MGVPAGTFQSGGKFFRCVGKSSMFVYKKVLNAKSCVWVTKPFVTPLGPWSKKLENHSLVELLSSFYQQRAVEVHSELNAK